MASYPDFGTTLKVDNRGDAWFRRARGPQPECCRKRTSAKRSPLRHSRRLAKRTLDRCAWVHQGTVAYNLHMTWKTALFLHTFTCTWEHSRKLLLFDSRLLGLALRLSRSCLFRCHRENLAALEGGTCAGSRALVSSMSIFPVASPHLAPVTLSFACFTAFSCGF